MPWTWLVVGARAKITAKKLILGRLKVKFVTSTVESPPYRAPSGMAWGAGASWRNGRWCSNARIFATRVQGISRRSFSRATRNLERIKQFDWLRSAQFLRPMCVVGLLCAFELHSSWLVRLKIGCVCHLAVGPRPPGRGRRKKREREKTIGWPPAGSIFWRQERERRSRGS